MSPAVASPGPHRQQHARSERKADRRVMSENGHILVVDDQQEICELVRDYLTGEGYSGVDGA